MTLLVAEVGRDGVMAGVKMPGQQASAYTEAREKRAVCQTMGTGTGRRQNQHLGSLQLPIPSSRSGLPGETRG